MTRKEEESLTAGQTTEPNSEGCRAQRKCGCTWTLASPYLGCHELSAHCSTAVLPKCPSHWPREAYAESKLAHILSLDTGITEWMFWLSSWWGSWPLYMPKGIRRGTACSNHHTRPIRLCMWGWLGQEILGNIVESRAAETKNGPNTYLIDCSTAVLPKCPSHWPREASAESKLAHILGPDMGITKWMSWLSSWWGCWPLYTPKGIRRGTACSNHHTRPIGLCIWGWLG